MTVRGYSSIFAAYNEIMRRIAKGSDVDGLVLLHDDVELLAPLSSDVRQLAADPRVGVIGVIGGKGHPGMVWWDGDRRGRVKDNQYGVLDYSRSMADVDTVDGLLMILTPAALKEVSFDVKTYKDSFHGYDSDICAQARAQGLRVVVADIPLMHHNSVTRKYGDLDMLQVSDARFRLKWQTLTQQERLRLRLRIARRLASRRLRLARTGSVRTS